MKTQELARHLLNRQNAGPLVFPGELIAAIGSDAVQEGLQRRWLIPELDSGMLKVSTDATMVEDMRSAAGKCPSCHESECICTNTNPTNESHGLAYGHARRWHDRSPLDELLSPGTGTSPDNGLLQTSATPAVVPPTPTTPPRPGTAPVAKPGETVVGGVSKTPEGDLKLKLGKPGDAGKIAQTLQPVR